MLFMDVKLNPIALFLQETKIAKMDGGGIGRTQTSSVNESIVEKEKKLLELVEQTWQYPDIQLKSKRLIKQTN